MDEFARLEAHRDEEMVERRPPSGAKQIARSPGEQRKPRSTLAATATPAIAATRAFFEIAQTEFPVPAHDWVAGARYDAAEASVRPDLAEGRGGRVTIVVGRQVSRAAVGEAMQAVLAWRLAGGILRVADLRVPAVQARLRRMRVAELRALRVGAAVDPAARDEIDRLLAIAVPGPPGAMHGGRGGEPRSRP